MSRSIEALHPDMQIMYAEFAYYMREAGISYVVTCTDRTIVEQMALYTQGRLPLADVNKFRKEAGLYLLRRESENRKVTWTLNSKHVTNGIDKSDDNDYSRAFDIVITKDGRAQWDLKVNVNNNELPDYEEAGRIWESLGGTWGGRWTKPDAPHFQL